MYKQLYENYSNTSNIDSTKYKNSNELNTVGTTIKRTNYMNSNYINPNYQRVTNQSRNSNNNQDIEHFKDQNVINRYVANQTNRNQFLISGKSSHTNLNYNTSNTLSDQQNIATKQHAIEQYAIQKDASKINHSNHHF